jgi:hypothetical protein
MRGRTLPVTVLLAVLGALVVSADSPGSRLDAATPEPGPAGLSGTWALTEEIGDPFAMAEKVFGEPGGSGRSPGEARGRGGRAGGGLLGGIPGDALDAPLEAVGDARRLVIADDGTKVLVTYPTGRKRVFYTDGEERELDDGGGPAKVTAKRKGSGGAEIVVSSGWPDGQVLKETWQLVSNPRRLLVVEGTVKGLHSFSYKRVYQPAPPQPPAARPAAVDSSALAAKPPAEAGPPEVSRPSTPAAGPPGTAAVADKRECSLRPARGASHAELAHMARIPAAEAERRAVASVGSQKVSSVISSDLEVDDGCLVWPFDLRLEGKAGVQEVLIDAGDGKVISSSFESLSKPDEPPRLP